MTQPIHSSHPSTVRISAGFTFLVLPFYINDFSSIFIQDWRWWLGIDYVLVKLVPLAGAAWLISTGQFSRQELGFKSQGIMTFIAWSLGLTLVCTLIDQNAYTLTADLPGYPPLGGMPAITSPFWDWIDLTLGLALVALCEELVFRGYLHAVFRQMALPPGMIIIMSSTAFGLAHWCLGLPTVLITGFIGAVLMIAYMRTGSLYAMILAHFFVNFIDFSGVIPKSIFQLF
ncbi:CPBP family intramembrane glutamic endopeptidase [Desulfotignum phosphitoxidans]|uniref:Abortive infection protein n=1 Tax=Desulfotignum phosphitoxidans DSM 13687 TaxID=1286635 RepID=S0FYZ9_9BACT|nr:CPBP family intramembrane glutamic endopeptidase [Desulfotignum phosphitoxidans]EMS78439.1 abortive infection protein [Desulfotignum phosphitoxidans DSM 13687]